MEEQEKPAVDGESVAQHNHPDPLPSTPPEIPQPKSSAPEQPATAQQLAQVENHMSSFERSTLKWARAAVIVSGLAFAVVCAQWYEMHSGSKDTHDLAVAAGNQATWTERLKGSADKQAAHMKELAGNMKEQADRTKELADRMKDQADKTEIIAKESVIQAQAALQTVEAIQRQTDVSERPWLSVKVSLSGDLIWRNGQPTLNLAVDTQNIGKSIAKNVRIFAKLIPANFNSNIYVRNASVLQTEVCENPPVVTNNNVDLFPSTVPYRGGASAFASASEVASNTMQWRFAEVHNVVEFYVVGCVRYQSSYSANIKQTFFGFFLAHIPDYSDSGEPIWNPNVPNIPLLSFELGENVPIKHLQLAGGGDDVRNDAN